MRSSHQQPSLVLIVTRRAKTLGFALQSEIEQEKLIKKRIIDIQMND
tara:strand:- start:937 stop:1077 length:141 start_codon:yes stop_codon:yes gene_type:complete